jgi:L-alanine-DL-glutamate epimerase-like enolase superfamily enzyme
VSIVERTPRWPRAFAIELAREVERLGFYWIEEPLHRGDVEGLAELRRSLSSLRVAGGELNACLSDYQRMLDADALDVYQPDAVLAEGTFSGGVTLVERLLPQLRRRPPDRRPLAYCPHTWTTGIGFVVNLHLMGLLAPDERHFLEFPIEGPWTPESWGALFDRPIAVDSSGRIALPTEPGLGVHLDWGKIKRDGTRLHRATPMRVALSAVKDRGLAVALEIRRRRSRSDSAPPREAA